jgi:NADPH:quinone reductase-like Zn-dependent oxidoreductase
MQAVLLEENGGTPKFGMLPVPKPGPGQVLVRMAAAPINPSDLGFLRGSYGFQKPFPIVPGLEGSGVVCAAGPGILPRLLLGRRVACSAPSGGTWAEYLVTSASTCFPLKRNLSLEQGATLIVNPMTALAFFDIAKQGKHAAIVSNAAASALGRMILRLGQTYHVPVIHLVRREEQMELLHSLGGEYVLNSSDPNFSQQLGTLSKRLKATLLLDPVGEKTREYLDAMPGRSVAIVYGSLSSQRIEPGSVSSQRITGFFLPNWIAKRNILQVGMDVLRVQRLAPNVLQTTIQKRFPLSEIRQAIELYQANPTAGKVLLVADPEKIQMDN